MASRTFMQMFYTLRYYPVQLDLSFSVDKDNTDGTGIANLKGPGIKNVFMSTSATPADGSPDPVDGTIVIELQDNYARLLKADASLQQPKSGTPINLTAGTMVVGTPYFIATLGTTTQAQFEAVGLQPGLTAAVGIVFIATATTGSGTGTVQAAAATGTGIDHIDVIGNADLTIGNNARTPYLIFNCMNSNTKTQPAEDSIITMSLYLSNSSLDNR